MEFLKERAERARALPPEQASEDSEAVIASYKHLAAAEGLLCERGADGHLQPLQGGPESLLAGMQALVNAVRYFQAEHAPNLGSLHNSIMPLCQASAREEGLPA